MTNKVILFIFIEIFTNFWASVITMSISESINKCAEFRQRCNPNSQQPCCNPNEVCVNKVRDQLDIFNYICLKKGVLDDSCKRSLDCEAIIGAKCSENGHCVCKKQTAEYNETICLHYSSTNRLIDEFMDNYYYFNEVYYLKNNYSSKTGCQRVSNTNYGESCSTDQQCLQKNHKNLKCINRECRCPNGTQFILDLLACKSSLRGVGKSCLINRKCLVENSYCNRFGICKCKNNYYYTAADKCELLKSRYNCSRSNANSLTDNKTFYKPAQKPNDPCFSNTDCKNVKYTSCQSQVCKCLKNFYVSEKTGNCTRYAKQPNDRCNEERGCWRVDNSKCKLGKCLCKDNFPFNPFTKKCELILSRKCSQNSDCDESKNIICSKGKCVCNENYFEKNGTCIVGINGFCNELEECFVEHTICEDNKCQCKTNFYASKNESFCIPKAQSLYDYCENDEGCQALANTVCFDNKCKCKSTFIDKEGKCRPLDYCETKSDCKKPKYSICRNHKCVCSPNKYLSSNNAKCISYAKSIGSSCENDKRCERLKNTKCNDEKKCTCIEDYYEIDNQCKGLIDANCSENSDCADNNSMCEFNKCQCLQNFYSSADKKECKKYADHVNESCEENDHCIKVKNSKCSEHDKCICKRDYFEKEGECKALLGVNCTKDSECGSNNAQCESSRCVCSAGFFPSPNKEECIKYATSLNDYCESNNYCKNIKYTYCMDNKCVCVSNYIEMDGKCKGFFGESCLDDTDCIVNNSKCEENICQCPADYYVSENKDRCYRYAKELTSFCESNIGCKNLKFTLCSKNKQCICLPNYLAIEGICRGLIGSNCSEDVDCAIDKSICKSEICQCGVGFYLSKKKDKCYPYAEEIDSFCESSIGCRDLNYTLCSENNTCACLENYTVVDRYCRGLIEAKCFNDLDCAVENSVCEEGFCQCPTDFYLSTKKAKCYPYAKNLNDFCEDNAGCRGLKYSQCAENNKCVCLDHYIEVDDYCRGLIEANCLNNSDCAVEHSYCHESDTCRCFDNFYQSENRGECYPLAQKIGDFCETNIGCRELEFTDCFENKCVCLANYTEVDDRCRGVINAKCFKDSDCATKNSVCESNTCRCSVGFYLSADRTQCHPLAKQINDFCETEFGCRDLRFTNCSIDKKCVCLQNYTKINDSCRGFIHANCFEASDCAAENSICRSNTCQCPDDFYLSTDERKCHPFAKEINDFCETDLACHDLKFTFCSALNKCTCLPTHIVINGHCRGLINAKCFKYSDCATENSVCESSTCQCSDDFYLSSDEKRCYQFAKHVNDFCETHIGCRDLKFTSCSQNNKCTCLSTHLEINGHCRGVMNSPCFENDDCAAINAICDKSNTCQCPSEFYRSTTELECYPFANRYNDFCEIDIGCRNVKYTHCSEHRCVCSKNYIVVNGQCRGLISAKCSDDLDCAVGYSYCDESNTCQCPADHYLSVEEDKCYPYAKQIHDFCENDDSCYNLNFSTCFQNKCICPTNYTAVDGNCRGFNEAKCYKNSDCVAGNSICESSFCQCPRDFYLSENQKECYQYAKNLHDFCETDESCYDVNFSHCSEGTCSCIINYVEINGSCLGLIGSKCSDYSECAAEHSICDRESCQCSTNFYPSVNNDKCYKYAEKLGDMCEMNAGCRKFNFTFCSEDYQCICSESYIVINESCRGFNEAKCNENLDCAAKNSICDQSSTCQCPIDRYLSADRRECYSYAQKLSDFCENDGGCRDLNFTKCSESQICSCAEGYLDIDGRCRGLIRANCLEDSDCAVEKSICHLGSCQCPNNYYLSENGNKCYLYAKQLNTFCETDLSCRDFEYSYCSENNICACLENYTVVDGYCRGLIEAKCFNDLDCAVENSVCEEGFCQCPTDFYLSTNKAKCYPYAKNLNDFCEDNAGCRDLKYSQCVENNKCICLDHYIEVDDYCRGLIEANCLNNSDCAVEHSYCHESDTCRCFDNFYQSENRGECYPLAQKIGDFCETNIGCRELEFTDCFENKCVCLTNYTEVDDRCRGVINAKCFKDSDCATKNSVCEANTCRCSVGFYLSADRTQCHPLAKQINDFCETEFGCRDLRFTNCSIDKKCVCLQNYTKIDNSCRGFIHANCFEASDCAAENSICRSNTCQCPDDFYLSADERKCHPFTKEMHDFCDTDFSCRDLKFTFCSENNKCTCLPNYTIVNEHCRGLIGSKCFNDSDCALTNSVCHSNVCQCRTGFYASKSMNNCHRYAKQFGAFCENDNACRNIPYTHCSEDNRCVCNTSYVIIDNHCQGFIGANCSNDSDCAFEYSFCDKNICKCRDDFYLSMNGQRCYAYAEQINEFCDSDMGCRYLNYSFCSKNNKCICVTNYTPVNELCRGVNGAECSKDLDCALNNSACKNNTCLCLPDFYLSETKEKCYQYAKQLNDFCETDDACRNIKFTHCFKNKCTCLPNYETTNGQCRGLVGSKCSETSDCLLNFSICKFNECQCSDEFYFSPSSQKCISFAKNLNDFCETDDSCRNIKFAYCNENKQCTCLSNYIGENDYCRGLIDENCIEDSDCGVENSICSSNVCQCSVDHYPSTNKQNCFQYASNIDDYCEDNEGCRKIKHSFCSDSKNCTCFSPYKENEGKCLGVFNASCYDDSDCDSFYQCSSNRCLCRDGFTFDDYYKCISVNRYLGDTCIDNDYCRGIEYSSCDSDFRCTCATNYFNVNGSCLHYMGTCCLKDSNCGIKNSVCERHHCQCKKNYFFHPFYLECRKK